MSENGPSLSELGASASESSTHVAAIKQHILDMVEKDQQMRQNFREGKAPMDPTLDRQNLEEMKKIINENGWPTRSIYGDKVASAAWLLVQHADRDVPFQEKCLAAMKALKEGEVDKQDLAYLEDRVHIAKGQPQLYGTQGEPQTDGTWKPFPIEDEQHVEERRKQVGMIPLARHIEGMNRMLKSFKPRS